MTSRNSTSRAPPPIHEFNATLWRFVIEQILGLFNNHQEPVQMPDPDPVGQEMAHVANNFREERILFILSAIGERIRGGESLYSGRLLNVLIGLNDQLSFCEPPALVFTRQCPLQQYILKSGIVGQFASAVQNVLQIDDDSRGMVDCIRFYAAECLAQLVNSCQHYMDVLVEHNGDVVLLMVGLFNNTPIMDRSEANFGTKFLPMLIHLLVALFQHDHSLYHFLATENTFDKVMTLLIRDLDDLESRKESFKPTFTFTIGLVRKEPKFQLRFFRSMFPILASTLDQIGPQSDKFERNIDESIQMVELIIRQLGSLFSRRHIENPLELLTELLHSKLASKLSELVRLDKPKWDTRCRTKKYLVHMMVLIINLSVPLPHLFRQLLTLIEPLPLFKKYLFKEEDYCMFEETIRLHTAKLVTRDHYRNPFNHFSGRLQSHHN